MTEKTKKVLVLVGAIVLCLALIAAIRLRFVGHSEVPPQIDPIPTQEATEPVVNIQNTQTPEETEPVVDITVPEQTPTPSTPVPSADPSSTGTEQNIRPSLRNRKSLSRPVRPLYPLATALRIYRRRTATRRLRPAIPRSRLRSPPRRSRTPRAAMTRAGPMCRALGILKAAARVR